MKGRIICIYLIVFSLHLSIQASGAIYSWVDEQGKRHFSDKPSNDKQSELFERDELATIKFVKAKPTYSKQKSTRRSLSGGRKPAAKKEKGCDSIQKTITRLEKKLNSKLAPDKFDRYKQELSQIRWKKIKHC